MKVDDCSIFAMAQEPVKETPPGPGSPIQTEFGDEEAEMQLTGVTSAANKNEVGKQSNLVFRSEAFSLLGLVSPSLTLSLF